MTVDSAMMGAIEKARDAERADVLALIREHLEWYPADIFDDVAGRALRWKLSQLLDEIGRGAHEGSR